jgi:hypothetical protein
MSVRVSPVSRAAALLIVVIGVFMLAVGQTTRVLEDSVAGTAFIILGIVLHGLLYGLMGKDDKDEKIG